jgi:hypothetical protein
LGVLVGTAPPAVCDAAADGAMVGEDGDSLDERPMYVVVAGVLDGVVETLALIHGAKSILPVYDAVMLAYPEGSAVDKYPRQFEYAPS